MLREMSEERMAMIDAALLCLSEARERAEAAAHLARSDGDDGLADVLADIDQRLLELHGELMRAAYLPQNGGAQLRLAASA